MIEQMDYRLAFILPQTRQILASEASGITALPSIAISRWNRPAEQLTRLIRSTWNIQAIVLDLLPGSSVSSPCAVIEVLTKDWRYVDKRFCAVDPNLIESAWLSDAERLHLVSIFNDTDAVPVFSRLGWVDKARRWIQASVPDCVVRFDGEIQQFQAGGNFALVRFGTLEGCGYWLKATGSPNAHEFSITMKLAQYLPHFLPPVVALEQAVDALSALQKQSILHAKVLLNAGCADRSVAVLQSSLEELIEYLDEAMEKQLSTKVQPLDKTQLSNLRSALNDACLRMQDIEISDALIHIDINPGNILFDGTRSVFIDWAEAAIGNPLVTFEYLAAHLAREEEHTEAWLPILRAQYRKQWLDLLSESTIDRAFALTPFSMAEGTGSGPLDVTIVAFWRMPAVWPGTCTVQLSRLNSWRHYAGRRTSARTRRRHPARCEGCRSLSLA